MNNQSAIEKQQFAIGLKAIKIGLAAFVLLLFFTHILVAFVISFIFIFILSLVMAIKAGLPLSHRKRKRFQYEGMDAYRRAELTDAPVVSALSVYRSAGSGFQIYHRNSRYDHIL